jgi:hypothetical protein
MVPLKFLALFFVLASLSVSSALADEYYASTSPGSFALIVLKPDGGATYSRYERKPSLLMLDLTAKWEVTGKDTGLLGAPGTCGRIFAVWEKGYRFDFCQTGDKVQEIDKTGVQRTLFRVKNVNSR